VAPKHTEAQSRFTKRYTAQHKDAILQAVLMDGHSVQEAIRRARAGQLGIPAFEIGNYAYDIVRDGREAYEARNDTALDHAIDEALRADAVAALKHDRALRARFKQDGTADPEALKRSAVAMAGIKKARREATTRDKTTRGAATTMAQSQTEAFTPTSANVIHQLLENAQATPFKPAPKATDEGARSGSLNRTRES
jgi:hypothetical protein